MYKKFQVNKLVQDRARNAVTEMNIYGDDGNKELSSKKLENSKVQFRLQSPMTLKEQNSSINAMHQVETPKQELNVKHRASQQLQSRKTTIDASGYPMNSNEQS